MRRLLPWLETALRRYPWVITLVALIPCAYFAARGTSEMIGPRLFAADTEALARPLPVAVAATGESAAQNRHVRDRAAIVHRNVFDSDAGCLDCDAGSGDAEADGGGRDREPAARRDPARPKPAERPHRAARARTRAL